LTATPFGVLPPTPLLPALLASLGLAPLAPPALSPLVPPGLGPPELAAPPPSPPPFEVPAVLPLAPVAVALTLPELPITAPPTPDELPPVLGVDVVVDEQEKLAHAKMQHILTTLVFIERSLSGGTKRARSLASSKTCHRKLSLEPNSADTVASSLVRLTHLG